tara:strand:- start:467 stop:757 length:291 start_codon:yes stop_codon:yes gene_type:complete
MSIDNSTVRKVAKLARIKLDNQSSEERLKEELNKILGWIDELKKVDTSNVEPMLSVYNESLNQRKDLPKNSYSTDDILKNAPEKKSDFFVVPKVVE